MKSKILYFFACIAFISLASCKTIIDNAIENTRSDPNRLINRTWIKRSEIHTQNGTSQDLFQVYQPCRRDDEYKFNKDGYYENNQGASSCYATQPFIIEQGTWRFTNSNKKLEVSGTGFSRVYDVVVLDTNYNFILSRTENIGGTPVNIRESFDPK
jgi:hypothetical protein